MSKENDDILEALRDRMREAKDAEAKHTERAKDDLQFLTGEAQWTETDRANREAEGKPTLTFNALPQFVRKICGQLRGMNPAIRVSAGDNMASADVAEIHEGLIREIEYRCDAASIYEGAAESAAQCGIGHFRIRADYCDADTFDQHILIEPIPNPFAVFYDPLARRPDRSDAQYAFVVDEMRVEDFKRAYPKAKVESFADAKPPAWSQDWIGGETVTVAEYYWIEEKPVTLYRLLDGTITDKKPATDAMFNATRKATRKTVKWVKTNGHDVLEGPQDVAGDYIPVIAVTGEEIRIGNEIYRSGAIRHAKDAQRAYNVMRTASVETTLLQPRAPYMVTAKQVAGLESFWNTANSANRPYLPYNFDGNAPPPSRVPPPLVSQALTAEAQIASEDMKRTVGIYDASLGARSNEVSGVAIAQRQREAETANSIYADNMVKAVAHAGRVIVSMIPYIYDAPRIVRILGEDVQEKMVAINELVTQVTNAGVQYVIKNDMRAGKYAVRVSVGPGYTTRKQEASEGMLNFMKMLPQSAPIIADLIAGSQEWPEADRIAERIRMSLPPNVLQADERDAPDPQRQAQMEAQAKAQAEQQQMQQIAAQAALKKQVAESEEAVADAQKARAEAEKARLEVLAMSVQPPMLPMQNVGPIAPVPGFPG